MKNKVIGLKLTEKIIFLKNILVFNLSNKLLLIKG